MTGESLLMVAPSTRGERAFFSVARTTPSTARMPRVVAPALTALRACSIWGGGGRGVRKGGGQGRFVGVGVLEG